MIIVILFYFAIILICITLLLLHDISFLGLSFQSLGGLRTSNNIKFGKTLLANLNLIHWDALAIILLFFNDILHYVFL